MRFTAGCAQFAPMKGAVSINLDRIADALLTGCQDGVDVLVFPETSVTGYFLEGGVLECSLTIEELTRELHTRLADIRRPIDGVVGFYERHNEMLYNSAAYIEFSPGQVNVLATYRKTFLPSYGVFDESRFLSEGTGPHVFETRFGTATMLICEDVWHSIMPTIAAVKGAETFYVLSASPSRNFGSDVPGNLERYQRMLRTVSEEHGVYCVHAMLVGFEGGKGFVGGSSILGPDGNTVIRAEMFEEALIVDELDSDQLALARANSPLLSDLQSRWSALIESL